MISKWSMFWGADEFVLRTVIAKCAPHQHNLPLSPHPHFTPLLPTNAAILRGHPQRGLLPSVQVHVAVHFCLRRHWFGVGSFGVGGGVGHVFNGVGLERGRDPSTSHFFQEFSLHHFLRGDRHLRGDHGDHHESTNWGPSTTGHYRIGMGEHAIRWLRVVFGRFGGGFDKFVQWHQCRGRGEFLCFG